MSKNIYHFFVEGEGERAIINTLKKIFNIFKLEKWMYLMLFRIN